jgi:hypothetical protein
LVVMVQKGRPLWVYAKPIRFPIRANKPIRYIGNV